MVQHLSLSTLVNVHRTTFVNDFRRIFERARYASCIPGMFFFPSVFNVRRKGKEKMRVGGRRSIELRTYTLLNS